MVNTWSKLEIPTRPEATLPPDYTYAVSFSTLCYNVVLCGIFYFSSIRTSVTLFESPYKALFDKANLGFVLVIFLVRTARTVLVFIQNSGSAVFPAASIMHLATFFPVLIIRAIYDCYTLYRINQIRTSVPEGGADLKKMKKTKAYTESIQMIGFSLLIEQVFAIIAIVIAFLEAVNFKGDALSYFDWILISWNINCMVEHRIQYRNMFQGASQVQTSEQSQSGVSSQPEGKRNRTSSQRELQ